MLAASLALVSCSCSWWATGRVVDGPCTHVGVRPASDGWGDYGATVQVSTDWPVCQTDAGHRP